jgi:ATP-dependent RNA helicase DeaD
MPREIRELVERFLRDPVSVTVTQPKAAPSRIDQQVYYVPRGWSKIKLLLPILEWAQPETAIIFVRTKMMATLLTAELKEAGQSVDEYHGSLSQHQRETLVRRFREGKIRLVVATDIAARGLDVENLSHVINYDLPDSSETYIHRIGRTGRAGKSGTAIALVQPMDQRLLRQIEQRLKQTMRVCQIPSQVEVQARRLASLEDQVKEALSGERMASFLPLVHQLGAEYDPLAIAAAALQMVYDKNCPQWLREGWDVPPPFVPKPKREGERGEYKGGGGGGYQGRRDRRDRPYRSEYKGDYKGGRSGSGSRRSGSGSSRFS